MAEREHEHELIGVFEDEQAAQEAARSAGASRVGEGRDEQSALRAEMREELDHTFVGPGNVGPFTKEMTKGLLWGTFLAGGIGLLLGLPFGFIPFGDSTLVTRLIITGGVGAAAGATLGFVLGGGWGGADSDKALAAERGVTVAAPDNPTTVEAFLEKGPIRVDRVRVEDGQPVATVTTEEQSTD